MLLYIYVFIYMYMYMYYDININQKKKRFVYLSNCILRKLYFLFPFKGVAWYNEIWRKKDPYFYKTKRLITHYEKKINGQDILLCIFLKQKSALFAEGKGQVVCILHMFIFLKLEGQDKSHNILHKKCMAWNIHELINYSYENKWCYVFDNDIIGIYIELALAG